MKINIDSITSSVDLHEFADQRELTLDLWRMANGRCAAKFGGLLIFDATNPSAGIIEESGVGDDWVDAVLSYARKMSGRWGRKGPQDSGFAIPRLIVSGATSNMIGDSVAAHARRDAA